MSRRICAVLPATLVLVVWTCAAVVNADDEHKSATLTGTVLDENGRPLADARVCVVRKTWPNDRYRTYANHTEDRGTSTETLNLRDRQMAENLGWLANVHYSGRKLIVWAASRHNLFNPQSIRGQDGKLFYDGITAMGHELCSLVDRDQMFSIGFTAWEGEAAPWFAAPRRIPQARTGSLEDICQRTGRDNLLLPLRGLGLEGGWLAAPLESRPLGYSPMTADWTQVFDAMVFNRTMTPSTRVE